MRSFFDTFRGIILVLAIAMAMIVSVVLGLNSKDSHRLERVEFGRQCHEQGVPAIANPWRSGGRWSRDWLEGWIEAAEGQE